MTYRDEPQSYSGPPPGLSTRLFLRLGDGRRRSFAVLIYPASAPWRARVPTALVLHDGDGMAIAEEHCGSPARARRRSGRIWCSARTSCGGRGGGYVLIRDATCRLFGYHGLMDDAGGFSLDHMFGF